MPPLLIFRITGGRGQRGGAGRREGHGPPARGGEWASRGAQRGAHVGLRRAGPRRPRAPGHRRLPHITQATALQRLLDWIDAWAAHETEQGKGTFETSSACDRGVRALSRLQGVSHRSCSATSPWSAPTTRSTPAISSRKRTRTHGRRVEPLLRHLLEVKLKLRFNPSPPRAGRSCPGWPASPCAGARVGFRSPRRTSPSRRRLRRARRTPL